MLAWNQDQKQLREAVCRLADRLNDGVVDCEQAGAFSRPKWDLLCRAGLFAVPVQETYGGLGFDVLTTMYLLEALGQSCEDAGLSFSAISHIVSTAIPIQQFGSPAQKDKYLPSLAKGEIIGAHAITEPDSGSDAFSMRTRAVGQADGYCLHGSKTFVTNGPLADVFIVYAVTDPSRGTLGSISAFIIEKGHPGFHIGRPIAKMGLTTSPFSEIAFDDCILTEDQRLGKEGNGFAVFNYVMKWEILCSFAMNLGEMQRQLDKCIDHARTRLQFGQPIGKYQSISNKIADMKIGLTASRALLYNAGIAFGQSKNIGLDLAIAKTFTSETFVQSSLDAIQIFGAYGYTKEYLIEKDLRNAVAGKIYSGSSEVQRNTIASMMGL